jgi:hypothetical protein
VEAAQAERNKAIVEGCAMRESLRASLLVFNLVLPVFTLDGTDAHRDLCHQRHACPSDHGTDVCGDRGRCDLCPDNEYCQGGRPRPAEQRTRFWQGGWHSTQSGRCCDGVNGTLLEGFVTDTRPQVLAACERDIH